MKKVNESIFNPALMFGIGLFPLLVLTTDLATSLVFGGLIMGSLLISTLLYYAFKSIILENVRIPIYAMIVFISVYFLDSMLSEFMVKTYEGIHHLIAFLFSASIVIYALEKNKEEEKLGKGLTTSILLGLGYFFSLVIVGLVREILGKGSIMGEKLFSSFNGFEFFLGVVGGMLVIVVFALIYNAISYFIKKRRQISRSLTERYELYLSKVTKIEEPLSDAENIGEEEGK